jgi:hypothetical protein
MGTERWCPRRRVRSDRVSTGDLRPPRRQRCAAGRRNGAHAEPGRPRRRTAARVDGGSEGGARMGSLRRRVTGRRTAGTAREARPSAGVSATSEGRAVTAWPSASLSADARRTSTRARGRGTDVPSGSWSSSERVRLPTARATSAADSRSAFLGSTRTALDRTLERAIGHFLVTATTETLLPDLLPDGPA